LEDERERISKTRSTLSEDAKKQNEAISQLTEELLRSRREFETRQAEMEQKVKFLNEDKITLKEQIEESKRIYTRQIEDLKMVSNIEIEETQRTRIEETKTEYVTQIKNITIEYENEVKKYTYENETIRNNLRELENALKLTKEKLEHERR
jgi:hypothetical protein